MVQSLSRGSGDPSRITLTVISLFPESSIMSGNYSMAKEMGLYSPEYRSAMTFM